MKKKLKVLALAAALLMQTMAMPVTAIAAEDTEITASTPHLNYAFTDYASCGLSASNGFAVCSSKLTAADRTDKITATQYLEKKSGSRYSITKVWIKTIKGNILTMSNGTNGVKDGMYRLRTVFKVFRGNKCETVTKYSNVRKIKDGMAVYDDEPVEETAAAPELTDEFLKDILGENLKCTFKDGVLTVSGKGKMKNFNVSTTAPFFNNTSIKSVVIEEGVTSVGTLVFNSCLCLESVSIPDTVTELGVAAFDSCPSLKSLYIPSGIKELGTILAFVDCPSLESIDVAEDNEYYCSVDGVLFNKSKTTLIKYPAASERKEYTIPEGVTKLFLFSFEECKNLEKVTFPDTIEDVGKGTFRWSHALKEVQLSDSVESIGHSMFQECTALEKINLTEHLREIDNFAFERCSALENVSIPASLTKIKYDIFAECTSLKNITVAKDNPEYCVKDGVLFSKDMTELLMYPLGHKRTEYTVPDTIECIDYAFKYSQNLKKVNIPNSVTKICDAFAGCKSLESMELPESVEEIGAGAFCGCESLKSITVKNPESEFCGWTYKKGGPYRTPFDYNTNESLFNGVIYGHKNSTAETFCEKVGYKFREIGTEEAEEDKTAHFRDNEGMEILSGRPDMYCDINRDGVVNIDDVKMLQEAMKNKTATSMMDVNNDGKINVFDVVTLKRIIAESAGSDVDVK